MIHYGAFKYLRHRPRNVLIIPNKTILFSIYFNFKVLLGHTRSVTCVALSHNGKLLASGQEIPRGHKAETIMWDYDNRMQLIRLPFHDGKVNYHIVYFYCSGVLSYSNGSENV